MESGEGIVPMDLAFSPPPAEFSPTPSPIPEAICCEQNKAVVSTLIGLIVVLFIFFIIMISTPLKRCIRQHTPVSDKRIERRYETIEGWIISKKVHSHNESCDGVQQAMLAAKDGAEFEHQSPMLKLAMSHDTADTEAIELWEGDEEGNECPICMEAFQLDEIVSWSPNEKCSHVFHHECIKEWLLRHGTCPLDREVFLPIDGYQHILKKEELRGLAKQRSQRISTSHFCLRDGLETVHRSEGLDKEILDCINTLTCSCIEKGELIKLRGSRFQGENTVDIGNSPFVQILDPAASLVGPNFGSFEVVLTEAARDEPLESDSDEEMGVLPARLPFREEAI